MELKIGDRCPAFTFEDMEGQSRSLDEFKGKYVFIDVWASWCYPCRKEYPYLQELEKKFEGQNVVFDGHSSDHVSVAREMGRGKRENVGRAVVGWK